MTFVERQPAESLDGLLRRFGKRLGTVLNEYKWHRLTARERASVKSRQAANRRRKAARQRADQEARP